MSQMPELEVALQSVEEEVRDEPTQSEQEAQEKDASPPLTGVASMDVGEAGDLAAGIGLEAGKSARIRGICSRAHAHLNGLEVIVLGWHQGHQRWDVRAVANAGLRMYLRSENLWVGHRLQHLDKYIFH